MLRAVTPAAGHDDRDAPILLIDRNGLAEVGILPETSAGLVADGRDPAGGAFDNADLTILVAPDALLLTTRSAAANWLKTSPANIDIPLMRVPAGGLREQLRAAAARGHNPSFVPNDLWCLPDMTAPWARDKEHADDLDGAGWMVYELESLDTPARLWLIRRDVIIAAGCALFLVGLVLAWTSHDCGWRRKCGTLATAAAVALLIPGWLAPLGTGLFLGFLGGWLVPRLKIGVRGQTIPSSSSHRAAIHVGIIALFIAGWLTGTCSTRAADSPPNSAASDRPIYDVLVPVDDHDRPAGDDVYLPQPLYDAISAHSAHRDGKAEESLLISATYRGNLVQDVAGKPAVKDDWSAHFELVTFAAGAILQVPFGGEDVHLVPDGVRLDGRTSEFEWKDGGRSLAIAVPQAGRHQLDLSFQPALRATSSATAVEFAIPRAPTRAWNSMRPAVFLLMCRLPRVLLRAISKGISSPHLVQPIA